MVSKIKMLAPYLLLTLFISIAASAAFLSYSTGDDYPLYLLICPVIVSAVFYRRWVYSLMLGASVVTALAVTTKLRGHADAASGESLRVIVAIGGAAFITSELIAHLSAGRSRAIAVAQAEESKYRLLFEMGPEPIFMYDINTLRFLAVNNAMVNLHGFSREEFLSMTLAEFVQPDEYERLRKGVQSLRFETAPNENLHNSGIWKIRHKTGSTLWTQAFSQEIAFGNHAARLVLAQDITQRVRAEGEMRSVTTGARCILWNAIVSELDRSRADYQWELSIPDVEAAQRLVPLEVPPNLSYADAWLSSKLAEDGLRADQVFMKALDEGQTGYNQEYRCRLQSGEIRWLVEDVQIEPAGPKRWQLFGVCTDVTERRRANEDLEMVTSGAGCILWNATVREVNGALDWKLKIAQEAAAARLLPLNVSGRPNYAVAWVLSKLPEDAKVCDENCRNALDSGAESYNQEFRCVDRTGQVRWFAETVRVEPLGKLQWRLVGVCTEVTERKHAEEAVRSSEERFRNLVEMSPDAIGIHHSGRFVYVNTALIHLLGATEAGDLVGKPIMRFIHPDFRHIVLEQIQQIQQTAATAPLTEERFLRLDGTSVDVEVTAIPFDYAGQPAIQIICRDITRRKQVEETIWRQAYHDALTGLPNRTLFDDRLDRALVRARRDSRMVAVVFMDLDDFKLVNDTLGHSGGDELLVQMAARLRACLRESDTVARMGGDEFTILLPDVLHQDDALHMVERILESVKMPFVQDGHEIYPATSIGISMYPNDGADCATLLRNADTALYRAKEGGKNHYELFTPSMNEQAAERINLEHRIRRALDRGEFTVFYQPQVSVQTGTIIGVEALLRWHSPELGPIPPGKFIPVAEANGFIVTLGEWVLRTACEQNQRWQQHGYHPVRIAVNISARQFREAGFLRMVSKIIDETGVNPECIQLEMTENMIMQYVDDTISKLHSLKGMGIHVSIDDFGTGYSSLGYLRQFDISALKIDRCFVQDIKLNPEDHPNDTAIVRAIIALAHSLNVTVVAEGVETEVQAKFLQSLECDEMQGHYVGVPLPPEELERNVFHRPAVIDNGCENSAGRDAPPPVSAHSSGH